MHQRLVSIGGRALQINYAKIRSRLHHRICINDGTSWLVTKEGSYWLRTLVGCFIFDTFVSSHRFKFSTTQTVLCKGCLSCEDFLTMSYLKYLSLGLFPFNEFMRIHEKWVCSVRISFTYSNWETILENFSMFTLFFIVIWEN